MDSDFRRNLLGWHGYSTSFQKFPQVQDFLQHQMVVTASGLTSSIFWPRASLRFAWTTSPSELRSILRILRPDSAARIRQRASEDSGDTCGVHEAKMCVSVECGAANGGYTHYECEQNDSKWLFWVI